MDIKDVVSVEEAAKILGYEKSSVTLLCRKGKLDGAFRIGHQWLIPRATVENYEKAPQGFAAIWERRREAEKAQEKELLEGENTGEETVEELEREILKGMRLLARKFNRLEKLLAQDKRRD
ncbi:MAG: helix-turn-helix domain-containing protein [Synergistaceae bacterium]|nr:helix-turn-helix domain-containing protein [Synergistaceae bacterium]MBQ6666146.1 helix-turn-helix domain-containing protein [Synergistaceae bacterium]MBQ6971036.1 helix-turn-helix domain-containing protein [Synergistaceae bacterium]